MKDPHVGWYEYRGARFKMERASAGFFTRYYVGEIQMPWHRGSMLALTRDTAWFARTPRTMFQKIKRVVNREYRCRERNGEPTDPDAWNRELPDWLDPLPEPERVYALLD